jgi:hypothetical protein
MKRGDLLAGLLGIAAAPLSRHASAYANPHRLGTIPRAINVREAVWVAPQS